MYYWNRPNIICCNRCSDAIFYVTFSTRCCFLETLTKEPEKQLSIAWQYELIATFKEHYSVLLYKEVMLLSMLLFKPDVDSAKNNYSIDSNLKHYRSNIEFFKCDAAKFLVLKREHELFRKNRIAAFLRKTIMPCFISYLKCSHTLTLYCMYKMRELRMLATFVL